MIVIVCSSVARAGTYNDSVKQCDLRAAHPGDAELPSDAPRTTIESIDHVRAIPACEQAVDAQPNVPRLKFELARAYLAAFRFEEAKAMMVLATNARYPAAMFSYANAYRSGSYQGVGINEGRGIPQSLQLYATWLEEAAAYGSPPAMKWLANEACKGTLRLHSDALQAYKRSIKNGHIQALRFLAAVYDCDSIYESSNKAEAERWSRIGDELNLDALDWTIGDAPPHDPPR